MFYCEIDKNGFCFHSTSNELPLSDTVILSETNEIGKMYVDGEWIEVPHEEPEPTTKELVDILLGVCDA